MLPVVSGLLFAVVEKMTAEIRVTQVKKFFHSISFMITCHKGRDSSLLASSILVFCYLRGLYR